MAIYSTLWVIIQYYRTYFVAQLGSTWVGLFELCLPSQGPQVCAGTRALAWDKVGVASAKLPACDHLICR